MKKLYLFRHGETDANAQEIWRGITLDHSLNNTGKLQAYELSRKLANMDLQVIYSSPLKRAVETASIHGRLHHIPVIIHPHLHEANYGQAEGLHNSEVQKNWPEVLDAWVNPTPDNISLGFPEGESPQECANRIWQVLEEIVQAEYSHIGVAVHAGIMARLLSTMGMHRQHTPNCCVLPLVFDGKFHRNGELF